MSAFPSSPNPVDDTQCDFWVQNHGSLYLLIPQTEAAQDWVGENIPDDAQWFGKGIVVEHRYIYDIVDGIRGDGLEVE
jgi:hypothetical protein